MLLGAGFASADGSARTVLLIDDDRDIQLTLQQLLETTVSDVSVVVAESGEQALELIAQMSFDLVISDYRLPGMDGLEVLRECHQRIPKVPRILVTGYPDVNVATEGVRDHVIHNFVTKPIEPDYVVEVVRSALNGRDKARA